MADRALQRLSWLTAARQEPMVPAPGGEAPPSRAGAPIARAAADRHSIFVSVMKFLLPSVATILVALVLIWPQLKAVEDNFRLSMMSGVTPEDIENLRMLRPRYMGIDDKNRPYMVTAVEARQESGDSDLVKLVAPKADMTLENGSWLALTAKSGTYRQHARILHLMGGVNVFHDSGHSIETATAVVDLSKGTAYGEDAVIAHGPSGTIHSQGFRVLDRGKSVMFTGKARMVLHLNDGKPGKTAKAAKDDAKKAPAAEQQGLTK